MPFVEHRGGGKRGLAVDNMVSRWDVEWEHGSQASADLSGNESWRWIRECIPPGGRVLEAGCGLAKWVAFLDRQGYEAHGLDYSHVAIEHSLAAWPGLRLVQGDLRHTPYHCDFFDGIVSFGAIEHDIDGPDAILKELLRVLKPGGSMFCTVPCMNGWRRLGWLAVRDRIVCSPWIRRLSGRRPDDVQFFEYVFTPKEYHDVLEKAGFEVLELVPLLPHNLDSMGRGRRALVAAVHRRRPWFLAHMMGAVCRKS